MTVVEEHRLVLHPGAGTFAILGEIIVAPWSGSTLLSVPEADVDLDPQVWVHGGRQFGPYDVVCRVHDGVAPEPGPEWEDVSEVSLTVEGLTVVDELDGGASTVLGVGTGEHRLRVSSRGRAAESEEDFDRDPEQPVEHFLVDLWAQPASSPRAVRETSSFATTILDPEPIPDVEGEAEAWLASGRIGLDVRGGSGARAFSGDVGSVRSSRTHPGTRRALFRYLNAREPALTGSPSWIYGWMGGPNDGVGCVTTMSVTETHPDQLPGPYGHITCVLTDMKPPVFRRSTWTWYWPGPASTSHAHSDQVPFGDDTIVTLTYDQSRDADGQPWTTMTVTHTNLPIEWVPDMQLWWDYQLDVIALYRQ